MVDKGKTAAGSEQADSGTTSAEAYVVKNPEAFAQNVARMLEELGKAASAVRKEKSSTLSPSR